jgi:hypothetical protein
LPPSIVDGPIPLAVLAALVGLYMTAWVCVMAHPEITTSRARGD